MWKDFVFFVQQKEIKNKSALDLTHEDWCDINIYTLQQEFQEKEDEKDLKAKQRLSAVAALAKPDQTPSYNPPSVQGISNTNITPQNVKTNDVQHTSYLKYASVYVDNKEAIIGFYKSLQVQGLGYNIFLRPYNDIDENKGVVPDLVPTDVQNQTVVTLYSKYTNPEVIPASFDVARKLLNMTTDGYVFLYQLIRLVHPMLSTQQIASANPPNYSNSGDLYTFADQIITYISNHSQKGRTCDNMEETKLYLDHLDDAFYTQAISHYRLAILNCTTPPADYLVPTIATTIDELCPRTKT